MLITPKVLPWAMSGKAYSLNQRLKPNIYSERVSLYTQDLSKRCLDIGDKRMYWAQNEAFLSEGGRKVGKGAYLQRVAGVEDVEAP